MEDVQRKEEAEKRNQEIRSSILAQVLDQDARARLNTIAITKPEKAKMVENMLINMAQSGRLGPKVTAGLVSLLKFVSFTKASDVQPRFHCG
ncbi:unnamed protein product [Trichobilharzia regenti]|nr:unnamed protein product [Trichobilharzia regenti]